MHLCLGPAIDFLKRRVQASAAARYHRIGSFHFCPMSLIAYRMGHGVS